MSELLFKEEVFEIVGAAMEVHSELGCGFLEAVYQEVMEIELVKRDIPFVAQQELPIFYKGRRLLIDFGAESLKWKRMVYDLARHPKSLF